MISKERWLELREVNVDAYVGAKQGMDYIAWGDMEYLLRKHLTEEEFVDWTSEVIDGVVYIQFEGHQSYSLAVSDFRNNAIENPDTTDIEDTRQRAFVKAAARTFGLGHKLYESSYHKSKKKATKSSSARRPSTPDFF